MSEVDRTESNIEHPRTLPIQKEAAADFIFLSRPADTTNVWFLTSDPSPVRR